LQALIQPPPKVEQTSSQHLAVVVLVVLVVLDVVEVDVNGHCGQPLQNQFSHATFHPPEVEPQSVEKHCPVVVVVLEDVVVLVVDIVNVVVYGHCGQDSQNH
jgi:hypothetical protein